MPKVPLPGSRSLYLLPALLLTALSGCVMTADDMVRAGDVVPGRFDTVVPFLQMRDTVAVEAHVNGETGRYLLDTGANISILDRQAISGETIAVTGAGSGEETMATAVVEEFELGGVRFVGTHAASGDLRELSLLIPGFRGIIGQPVLSKADWLIDYERGQLRIGNVLSPEAGMIEVPVHYRLGLPHVVLTIDGRTVEALLDAGATTYLAIPESSPTASLLRENHSFAESERQIFTVGGTRRVSQQSATLPQVALGSVQLLDVPVELRDTNRPRLGARFLADRGVVLLRGGGNLWVRP